MQTRRTFLTSALAASGLPVATLLKAEVSLGAGLLTTVSDGHLVLPESFVIGDVPVEEARALIEAAGYATDGLEAPCNLTLWQSGDRRVLFDAGSGQGFMPTAGQIIESLAALDLSPGDITDVIFTHGHPDHLWGVLDDFDEPLFAGARHFMGAGEHAHWSDPGLIDTLPEARKSFAAGAARRLELLGDRIALFGDGDSPVDGVTAVLTPGHTPGHMAFRITDGEESLLVVGDAIGNGHLALSRPEWPNPADEDPVLGAETRMALLADLAASGEAMVGFHLPQGGMGLIESADEGYGFAPL